MRYPFAKFLMWLMRPVLAPMLGEMDQLTRLSIQKSVHFGDVYERPDGSVAFQREGKRYRFVTKE